MRSTRMLLVTLLFVLAAAPAKAGLLLEPYLSYDLGVMNLTFGTGAGSASGGTAKLGANGIGFGARVGYTIPMFFAGLDYSMADLSLTEISDSAAALSADKGSRSSLFAIVGTHILFFRGYLGYGLIHDVVAKDSTGDSTFKGSGAIKIGGSFTGLPIVALNLEYIMATYDKVTTSIGDLSVASDGLYSEAKSSTVILSVSAPFDL